MYELIDCSLPLVLVPLLLLITHVHLMGPEIFN